MTTLTVNPAATIDPTGAPIIAWEPTPHMTFDEFVEAGRQLGAATRVCQFLLGDWANHGEDAWGEKYDQVADVTGYDYGTLRHFASTAARVDPHRRRHALTYSHHAEVACLDAPQQDEVLHRAETDHLTVLAVRNEVKALRDPDPDPHPAGGEVDLSPHVAKVRAALRNLATAAGATEEATAVLICSEGENDATVEVRVDGLIVNETA